MKKKCIFGYKREIRQNPYSGIMSFQHFNGEKLYSDCITGRMGTAGTETEDYECYPVTPGVEEKGREQGFYPENTIAYIRVLWKEFEPVQNNYNYQFIDDILSEAKRHNQVVAFRLMPHSTCARDDVPSWLKKIIKCPERPQGMRVKDSPADDRFLTLFGKAIEKLGKRFDGNPVLYSVDIALCGSWGENSGNEKYPRKSFYDLLDIYINNFSHTILIGQLSRPDLLDYVAQRRKVGWRGDGAGQPRHMNELYPPWIKQLPKDLWKTAPVSFESYWWITEWYRQGWNIDEIIEKTLSWHISSFNPKSFPLPYQWKDKIYDWIGKMGYHYMIESCFIERKQNNISLQLNVNNVGVAPVYTFIPLKIKLKSDVDEYVFDTDVDIRKWIEKANENILVDLSNVRKGIYDLEVGIQSDDGVIVYFATDADFDNGYYKLCSNFII